MIYILAILNSILSLVVVSDLRHWKIHNFNLKVLLLVFLVVSLCGWVFIVKNHQADDAHLENNNRPASPAGAAP